MKSKKRRSLFRYILPIAVVIILLIGFTKYLRFASNLDGKASQKKLSVTTCPYTIPSSVTNAYPANDLVDGMALAQSPVYPQTKDIKQISEPFKPYEPPSGDSFFPPDTYPWTPTYFDVDNDGQNEEILTANIAMNHTPHLVRIVKNNTVIFKYQGINVDPQEVDSHDGFLLGETLDWLTGVTKKTRYIYKDGAFVPVWEQTSCQAQQSYPE